MLWGRMDATFQRHKSMLEDSRVTVEQIDAPNGTLADLERFWIKAAMIVPHRPEALIRKAVNHSGANAYFPTD